MRPSALNISNVQTNGNLTVQLGGQIRLADDQMSLLMLQIREVRGSSQDADTDDAALQQRIGDAVDLCQSGSAKVCLNQLEKLEREGWSAASSRNRCRMRASAGFAHFVLGDETKAAECFRKAYAEDAGRPAAKALLAMGQMLSGENVEAYATASQVLAEDPACEQAAAVLPVAAPTTVSLAEIEALVPVSLRAKWDVLLGFVTAARIRKDDKAALAYAQEAHELAPVDWRTRTTLGEELLGPVFSDETIALTKAIPTRSVEDFRRGLVLLREAWDWVKATDHAGGAIHVAANLAAALAVSGDAPGAETVINEGLDVRGNDRTLLMRRAVIKAERGDWAGMRSALSDIPSDKQLVEDRLLYARAALMCNAIESARAVVATIEDGPIDARTGELVAALSLEIALLDGGGPVAIAAAWDAHPESVLLRSVALDGMRADEPLRERAVTDICRIAFSADADARTLAIGADALAALGQHSLAADLFGRIDVPVDRHTLVLSGRLRALLLADQRREARALFESIAPAIRDRQPYLKLGMVLYERIGLLKRAIRLADRYLEQDPADLGLRMAWVQLCEREGGKELLRSREWLAAVPPDVEGGALELMALAQAVNQHVGDAKSFRIGYRALRLGYDDPAIHAAYAFGLFLMGRASRASIVEPEVVRMDTAVTLEQVGGTDRMVRIIETEDAPRLERDELQPDNAVAVRLLGLQVGSEIEFPRPGGDPRRFKVTQIENKFLHAMRRCINGFHDRFPDSMAFGTFKIDPGSPDDGMEAVLSVTRQRSDYVNSIIARYREGSVPFALAAAMAGSNVFDTWEGFRAHPDVLIHCSSGRADEAEQAIAALNTSDLVIIDPLLPYTAVRLGLDEALRQTCPRMGITQSALDLLRALVAERQAECFSRRGTLSWNGDGYLMHEISAEETESRVATAEAALAFASRCQVVAAEGDGGFTGLSAQLLGILPSAFLDTALAAQEPGRVLLCDDLVLRSILGNGTGIRAFWTQDALRHGATTGKIASDAYYGAVARLVESGYSYVRIGPFDIIHEFRRYAWHESPIGCGLMARLALPQNEPPSVLKAASKVLILAYWENQESDGLEKLAVAMATGFVKADASTAKDWLTAIWKEAERWFRSSAWRLNSDALLETTNLVPVKYAVQRMMNPAAIAGERIRAALAEGLRIAGVQ